MLIVVISKCGLQALYAATIKYELQLLLRRVEHIKNLGIE